MTRARFTARPAVTPHVAVDGGQDWRARAACAGTRPDLHHPSSETETACAEALAVCARCPVVAECRDYADAVETPSKTFGVWGAETPQQRASRRRTAAKRAKRAAR